MKKTKIAWVVWWVIAIILWAGSLITMIITNIARTTGGIETFYSDAVMVTLGSVSYSVFLAMTMALGVGVVIEKVKNGGK